MMMNSSTVRHRLLLLQVAKAVYCTLSCYGVTAAFHVAHVVPNTRRSSFYLPPRQMGGYDASSFLDIRGAQYSTPTTPDARYHTVFGIKCVEVEVNLDCSSGIDRMIGPITVLEATAESQDDLVNAALEDVELPSSVSSLNKADPYGAVLWPASSAIAKHLLDTTMSKTDDGLLLQGKTVLELGTGTGLVSLAAVRAGATRVIATDYEDIPLRLLEHAEAFLNDDTPSSNKNGNAAAAGKLQKIETRLLDICDHDTPLPEADIVVAADIMYEPITGRAMAKRAVEALQRGSRVLIGDSPGRAGRPAFLQELRQLLQPSQASSSFADDDHLLDFTNVVGKTCTGYRHDLICGKGSTSISETTPQDLIIAIMDLNPADFELAKDRHK